MVVVVVVDVVVVTGTAEEATGASINNGAIEETSEKPIELKRDEAFAVVFAAVVGKIVVGFSVSSSSSQLQ